jgi:hypothetical protein
MQHRVFGGRASDLFAKRLIEIAIIDTFAWQITRAERVRII